MGRAPCCGDHEGLKRGPWTAEEDEKLIHYVQSHGLGNWGALAKRAGLLRCGKSCRLRWANYLRPDIKRGAFSMHEDLTIIRLHAVHGNKWSTIASHLDGRTDNEIKNHWNTKLKKQLLSLGIDPVTHMSLPTPDMLAYAPLNSALVEAELGALARYYTNISHYVSAGSANDLSPLSQLLKLLGTHENHPWQSLSSISTDQFVQTEVLRWSNSSSRNQMSQGFVSGPNNNSTKDNVSPQEFLQFSDLETNSEGENLPSSTDQENEQRTASFLIEDQRSASDAEIGNWNSMPNLMPPCNPDKNDHLYYYGDKQSSSSISTNVFMGGSEILESSIQHEDDLLKPAIRISDTMSQPADREDLLEDESNYWVNLLNSVDNNPMLSLPIP